ncbi:NAD(P)/FAD-dependent oxidoreductase [Streptomyces sp. LRa12]|nr:NAD(P)/FAD-dependent oxidoreductase [Streptomyces sp. LRa12]
MTQHTDVVVIGGGQAGLAAGYHLRRQGLDFVVLDARATPGGAWRHAWDSLHLFSPAAFSSLPGRLMPAQPGEEYPEAGHVVAYLSDYEKRYGLPVRRPVQVTGVHDEGRLLRVETDSGTWHARAVISATGTWWRPFLPAVPGRGDFAGRQLHTVSYRGPQDFAGRRVIVVGGGNSGAQIAADLAYDTELTWVTRRPPRYLADDIDGRALFDAATALPHSRLRSSGGTPIAPSTPAAPAPQASHRWATSSPYRRCARPGTPGGSRRPRCSSAWTATVPSGPTARGRRSTRSSGAPASARPSRTWRPSACAAGAGTSPRWARRPRTSHACTSSATATGPAPPPPPSSASGVRPATRPALSPNSSTRQGDPRAIGRKGADTGMTTGPAGAGYRTVSSCPIAASTDGSTR